MGKYLDKIRQHEGTQPIETVKAEEALKPRARDPIAPIIQPGTTIAWLRADGTRQIGLVDFVHVDEIGTRWAFVTLPDASWAAISCTFLKGSPT